MTIRYFRDKEWVFWHSGGRQRGCLKEMKRDDIKFCIPAVLHLIVFCELQLDLAFALCT